MMKKRLFALTIVIVMTACLFGCNKKPSGQQQGTTPSPLTTPGDIEQNTISPETTSKTDTTPQPGDVVFTVFSADELVPYIQAILESYMLKYNGSTVFKPDDVTVELVNAYLYAYAQANAYTPEMDGAMLSEYEVTQLLSVAFGDAYTYDMLIAASDEGKLTCTLSDGAWDFGGGESYSPVVTYINDSDIVFDENSPITYTYTDAFDENIQGDVIVYLVQNDANVIGYSIAKIELVNTK